MSVRLLCAVRSAAPAGSWHAAAERKRRDPRNGASATRAKVSPVPQEPNRTVRVPRSPDDSAARSATAWLLPFQNNDNRIGRRRQLIRRASTASEAGGRLAVGEWRVAEPKGSCDRPVYD